jgi:nucleoside-diphosphate-sugar epimerase
MAVSIVTGAHGFIGANLVRSLLAAGDDVHAIVRPDSAHASRNAELEGRVTFHECDITDAAHLATIVREITPERVFHLAHYGGNRGQADEAMIRHVIMDGTAALYDACRGVLSIRAIVHTGSSSEYGIKSAPMREDMVLEPHTAYGAAKGWATVHGQRLAQEAKLPIVTVRPFSVYGAYEAPARLVPAAIRAAIRGEALPISDPTTPRDFIHVDDVVEALLQASTNVHPGEIFNLGSGTQIPISDMVDMIERVSERPIKRQIGAITGRNSDVPFWQADITHTRDVLGWSAHISLEEGVRRTFAWFYEHPTFL